MKWLRHWPLALGALLPALAVVELVGNAWTAHLVPDEPAFEAAAAVVAAEHRDGDLVIVHPEWLGAGRVAMGPWIPLEDETRADVLDYPRIWVLTLDGRRHPDTEGLPVEREWAFDGLRLTRFRNTRYAPALWRAYDHVADAAVAVRLPEGEKPCRWDGREGKHQCGPPVAEPWVWVGPFVTTDMAQQAHFCLWSHPTQRGPVVITFEEVPAGRTLSLYTAMTYVAARDMDKPPVHIEVEIDGRLVGAADQPDGAPWQRWSFPVPDGPPVRTVRFLVSAVFQGMRHFCFDAAMRGAP